MTRFALLIILLASAAFGQDISQVTGTVRNGSTIVIHGSGFGPDNGTAHGPIFVERWEDAGAAHDEFIIDHNPNWAHSGVDWGETPYYDQFTRTGEGFSMRWVSADTTRPHTDGWADGNPSWPEHTLNRIWPESRRSAYDDKVFASWWFNCEFPGANAKEGLFPQQWKMMHPFSHWDSADPRLGSDPDGSKGWAQWTPFVGVKWQGAAASKSCETPGVLRFEPHHTKPAAALSTVGFMGCAAADRKRPYFPDRPAADKPWSAWVQFEVYYKCSSGFDQADAEIMTWVSVLPANPKGSNADSKSGFKDVVPGKNETRTFHHALTRLGLWIGKARNGEYSPHSGYWDDIYIADTWRGVVLANSDDWATATVRERCRPTAWADGEISATVYTGAFADGETVWLYVLDDDRVPSAPVAVEIAVN